ncbi:Sensor protein gacS [Candidatus Terasakiella magnetica]|nr:Sensor protein gacS [Candidatus Terasakiella magnetica]
MLSAKTKIVTRLTIGFAAVLLLTAAMTALALHAMTSMTNLANDLFAHPFTVSRALLQVRADISDIRVTMYAMVHAQGPVEAERLIAEVAGREAQIESNMAVVRDRYLGQAVQVHEIMEALARWKSVRDRNIALVRAGRMSEAEAGVVNEALAPFIDLRTKMDTVHAFATAKAENFTQKIETEAETSASTLLGALAGLLALGAAAAWTITRSIVQPLANLRHCMAQLSAGDLSVEVPNRIGNSETAAMARAVEVFKSAAIHLDEERWIKDALSRLATQIQGTEALPVFGTLVVDTLAPLMEAGVAVLHIRRDSDDRFERVAGWSDHPPPGTATSFAEGEGVAGQCARTRMPILLENLPEGYIRIGSATGEASPRVLLAAPLVSRGATLGVIELAAFAPFTATRMALVNAALPIIALNLEILQRNIKTRELLEWTQQQAEELQASEEELRSQSDALHTVNEELHLKSEALMQQAEELRVSEEELKVQHEALQGANEELTEKTYALEERSAALEIARGEANRRAIELDMASRYKSEFLANMSHELRTPLNSLLILAKSLADNDDGNLTDDQIESATVVHDSGRHLLNLINDILDLSKIEAGKMNLNPSDFALESFATGIRRRFGPVAGDKGLDFSVEWTADLPAEFRADRGKLDQIVNNLVGNALKFTSAGHVDVRLHRATAPRHLGEADAAFLALSVSDSGIGIAPGNAERVFRAFEQEDGGTARQFGGTGLGLAISRQLAQLMGGDITLESREGAGSIFTLYLPLVPPIALDETQKTDKPEPEPEPPPSLAPLPPVAAVTAPDLILVVEDDPVFGRIVCDIAHRRGFRTLVAEDGVTAVELACLHRPAAIVLDIGLPRLDGWSVIKLLKSQPETATIPFHIVSAHDEKNRGMESGAVGFLTKPVSKDQLNQAFEHLLAPISPLARHVLVVDDDSATRNAITAMLRHMNVDIECCDSAAAGMERLKAGGIDCLILDLMMPQQSGLELLQQAALEKVALPPVIIYSAAELTQEQTLLLREFTDSIVIKGARSPERLLDEVSLFLHSVHPPKPRHPDTARPDTIATGSPSVLVVDDDMRNAFALSKVLRGKGFKVLIAQDGQKALLQVKGQERIDIVLMDIMMPGMDGYDTMREIRKMPNFQTLPIIALTAKAMVGDRDKCIAAGATEYMTKPVDVDCLVKMMVRLLAAHDG